MSGRRLAIVAGAVLAAAAWLPVGPIGAAPLAPAATAAAARHNADVVEMSIDDLRPLVPVASAKHKPLVIGLTLVNTSGTTLTGVRIVGERGSPFVDQAGLDGSIEHGTPSATGGLPAPTKHPVQVDLPPNQPVHVTFTTSTSTTDDGQSICLCTAPKPGTPAGVYPLYFTAHVTEAGGVDQEVGVVTTYLPSFYATPSPLHVSWVWPLLEPPHRTLYPTVFTDDELANAVAEPDGRLSRALAVIEQVGPTVPITLLVDPDLLDEIEVMANKYTVPGPNGKAVPGSGHDAAAAWLQRLHTVLQDDPQVRVQLTPYADPDIEALASHGLSWSSVMPSTMTARVARALAGRPVASELAWPAGGAISGPTLDTLVADGASTLLLDSDAVKPAFAANAVPAGLARLRVAEQDVAVGLLSPTIEKDVAQAVTIGGQGAAALPDLTAELAIRPAQATDSEQPPSNHTVVLIPPRYVDPDVPNAVRTILTTSTSVFASPIGLDDAVVGDLVPTALSRLAAVPTRTRRLELPAPTVATVEDAGGSLTAITALLDPSDPGAHTLLAAVPAGIQRAESSAWRTDADPRTGLELASRLMRRMTGIEDGVHIVRPSSGSYTLASKNSPLPITVQNDLPYGVRVQIEVTTLNGLPVFSARPQSASIDAHRRATLRLSTKVDLPGRIQVQAFLLTPAPDATQVGPAVPLTIRSTALGVVGVVITIVAGVVLVGALFWRSRWRFRRRRGAAPPDPTPDDGAASPPGETVVLPAGDRIPVDEPEHAP